MIANLDPLLAWFRMQAKGTNCLCQNQMSWHLTLRLNSALVRHAVPSFNICNMSLPVCFGKAWNADAPTSVVNVGARCAAHHLQQVGDWVVGAARRAHRVIRLRMAHPRLIRLPLCTELPHPYKEDTVRQACQQASHVLKTHVLTHQCPSSRGQQDQSSKRIGVETVWRPCETHAKFQEWMGS